MGRTTKNRKRLSSYKLTQFQLYSYHLDKANIDYKNHDNSLDYDKIYEILKYNVVSAFVGGGGGVRDNEVYAIVKLLELTHKTTLGYPKKLCNSEGMWSCNAEDRANQWIQFLEDHHLLKQSHTEPISFHAE